MDYDQEQEEIVQTIKNLKPPKGESPRRGKWNKFLGDTTNRVVLAYLRKYIPNGFTAIGPGVYIEGLSTEFDSIIISKQAEPIKFTNAYPIESVSVVIEVKKTGVFYKKEEAEEEMRKHRDKLITGLKELPLLYLTGHESERLIEATRQVYGDTAFFLSTGRDFSQILQNEWKRFVEAVLLILGS